MDKVIFIIITLILVVALIHSHRKNTIQIKERSRLVNMRDASLKIADKVVNAQNPGDQYQFILEACLKLIPKAKFGSLLMFNTEGLLAPKVSVGYNLNEVNRLRLRLEEVPLYTATKGKMDKTVIMNRIEDIIKKENVPASDVTGSLIRSEVASPLYLNGELMGVLCASGDQVDIFEEQDIDIMEYMASQICIVIHYQKLYGQLLSISKYDSLSQMMNRDTFVQETEKLLSDPSKDAPNLFFVLMNLDDMKAANGTYGHPFGDEIVKGFSEIIRRHLGKNDVCGRYGGDEFAAIIQGDHLLVNHLLEDARTELMNFKGKFTNDFVPSFSYGKASFIEGDCSIESLYRLAGSRMDQMKRLQKSEKK